MSYIVTSIATLTGATYTVYGICIDNSGYLYVVDGANGVTNYIWKIAPNITRDVTKFFPNSHNAQHICVDNSGNLYISSYVSGTYTRIIKITPDGITATVFASGFTNITALCIDTYGNIYVADSGAYYIKKITPSGVVSALNYGMFGGVGGLCVDTSGYVYITNGGSPANVYKMSPSGDSIVFASGFLYPKGITIDKAGNLYVCDGVGFGSGSGGCIKKITPSGIVSILYNNFTGIFATYGMCIDTYGTNYFGLLNTTNIYKLYIPPPSTPLFLIPSYNTTTSVSPKYINASGGVIGISGDANNIFYVSVTGSTIPTSYTVSGIIDTSGTIVYSGLSNDGPFNFTVYAVNTTTSISSASATVYLYYKTLPPSYPTLTISGGSTYSLSSAVIPVYTDKSNPILTFSGDTNVIYTVTHLSGGSIVYDLSGFNASGGRCSFTHTLPVSYIPVPYTVVIQDYVMNSRTLSFALYVIPSVTTTNIVLQQIAGIDCFSTVNNVPALQTGINQPYGVCSDISGNIYYVDSVNKLIRKLIIQSDGTYNVVTIAGNGTITVVNNVPALQTGMNTPKGICIDTYGIIYYADLYYIRKLTLQLDGTYNVVSIAGNGTITVANNVYAFNTGIHQPNGICVDTSRNVYYIDSQNKFIRKLTPQSDGSYNVLTIAGNSTTTLANNCPALSSGMNAGYVGLCIDSYRNLYYCDDCIVRKLTLSGDTYNVLTIAGTYGANGSPTNGPALSSYVPSPVGLGIDISGNVYVSINSYFKILKISPQSNGTYNLLMIAGNNTSSTIVYSPTPISALATGMGVAYGVCIDYSGNVYCSDSNNNIIRKFNLSGNSYDVLTIAGIYIYTDNALSTSNRLTPGATCIDIYRNIYYYDQMYFCMRKLTLSGGLYYVRTIAGIFGMNNWPINGPALSSPFVNANGICVDVSGNIYTTQGGYNIISKFTPQPDGTYNQLKIVSSGLSYPTGICVDTSGNVYYYNSNYINKLTLSGSAYSVNIIAGNGTATLSGGLTPISALLTGVDAYDMCIDLSRNLYYYHNNYFIRKLTLSGDAYDVLTIAGNGTTTLSGTTVPIPALQTGLSTSKLCSDIYGNIYFYDTTNFFLRKLTPSGSTYNIQTIAKPSNSNNTFITIDTSSNLYINTNNLISKIIVIPQTPTFTKNPVYSRSSGSISISGEIGDALFVSSSLSSSYYTFSGVLVSSSAIIYTGVPDGSYSFTVYTTNITSGVSSTPAIVYLTVKTTFPVYPVMSISGITYNYPYPSIYLKNAVNTFTLSGDTNVIYSLTHPSGGVVYDFSNADASISGIITKTVSFVTATYTICGADYAGNSISAPFTCYILPPPSFPRISISGSTNPYATINASGGILYTNASGGLLNMTVSGVSYTIVYDVSFAGQNPSGSFIGVSGTVVPYTNLSGTTQCIVTLTDIVSNRISYPFTIQVNTLPPSYPTLTISGGSTYSLSSAVIPVYTDKSNPILTFSGDTNVIYTVTHLSGGSTVYDLSGFNASGGSCSFTHTLPVSYTPVPYTVVIQDYAANSITTYFSMYVFKYIPQTYTVSTIAGGGSINGISGGRDDLTGRYATFNSPNYVCIDNAGYVYVADTANHLIRKITPAGVVSTLAGGGSINGTSSGYADLTGPLAKFNLPYGICVDISNNIYVADTYNQCIRKITPDGNVTTIAGTNYNSGNTDGPGPSASFYFPKGICIDTSSNLYVADYGHSQIRKLTLSGSVWYVTTIAGGGGVGMSRSTGVTDSSGIYSLFSGPTGICVDKFNNLYIGDSNNGRVRKITLSGGIWYTTTLAGNGGVGYANGPGLSSTFYNLYGLCVDTDLNVYVADSTNGSIRKLTLSGGVYYVSVFAGSGTYNIVGGSTDGPVLSARFYYPTGVSIDSSSNLYVADTNNNLIRKITIALPPTPTFLTPYTNTSSINPKYINASGGSIGVSGELNDTLTVTSSLSGANFNASGTLFSSGIGFINFFGVSADSSFNFTVYTTNILYNSVSLPSTVYVYYKTTMPSYPTLTISGGYTYSLSSTPISIFIKTLAVSLTLSGDTNVIYSLTHPSGGPIIYDFSNEDVSSSRFVTKSLSLISGIAYTVSGSDYAGNSTQAQFTPYILTAPSFPILSISGSVNPYATINASGGILYTNASGGSIRMTISGAPYTIVYDVSFAGQNPSGSFIGVSGTVVPFANLPNSTSCVVSLTDPANNRVSYPFTVKVNTIYPSYPTLTVSGSTTIYSLSSSTITIPTRFTNGSFSLSGSANTPLVFYSVSGLSGQANYIDSSYNTSVRIIPYSISFAIIYLYSISITDQAGNTTISTFNIRMYPPNPTFLSPYTNTTSTNPIYTKFNGGAISISGEATNIFYVSVSGSSIPSSYTLSGVIDTSGTIVYSGLSNDGPFNFTVKTTNSSSIDSSSATVYLYYKTLPPSYPKITIGSGSTYSLSSTIIPIYTDASNSTLTFVGDTNVFYTVTHLSGGSIVYDLSGFNASGGRCSFAYSQPVSNISVQYTVVIKDYAENSATTYFAMYVISYLPQDYYIKTIAGTGAAGFSGENVNATLAMLSNPTSIYFDPLGNIYIGDNGNYRIRKIDTAGIISTFAGNGTWGLGSNGPAILSAFTEIYSICSDLSGNIYLADFRDCSIRKIDKTGNMSRYAGIGNNNNGFAGDGGPATSATLNYPKGVCADSFGNIYISDTNNNRIRKVDTAGTITTIVGSSSTGAFNGDTNATSTMLNGPEGICVDSSSGTIYFADSNNYRIRKMKNNVVTTIAGTGSPNFFGDGGPATNAGVNMPKGVCIDSLNNIYFSEYNSGRIRKIDTSGIITTIAGNGTYVFSNDIMIAKNSSINGPYGICIDSTRNIYFADSNYQRIRQLYIQPPPPITPSYLTPYANTTSLIPKYINVSGGSIGVLGEVVDILTVTSSLSGANFNASGALSSSGLGYINFFGLSADGPFNFTVKTTNSSSIDSSSATVYLYYKTFQPKYPTLTISGGFTYLLSSIPISIFIKTSAVSLTLSGDTNIIYTLTHPSGGPIIYDFSNADVSSSGFVTKSLSLISGIAYTVSGADYAGNSILSQFTPYILSTSPSFPILSVSGSVNPYATINASGGILYTNASGGSLLMTVSGAPYTIVYDVSFAGQNPSGSFIGVSGTVVPFANLPSSTSCIVSLTDPANNRVSYPFTVKVNTTPPSYPILTISGYTKTYSLSSSIITIPTRFTNSTFSLSGTANTPLVFYSVSGLSGQTVSFADPSYNATIRTISYNLINGNTYLYSATVTDQANNPTISLFNILIDTIAPVQPTYTISGSSTSVSGGTIYTNSSGGTIVVSLSGEVGTIFDLSYAGRNPSGTLDSSGTSVSYTGLLLGTTASIGTFVDTAGNTYKSTLNILYSNINPRPPVLNVSGSTFPATTLSGGPFNVYTRYTNSSFTLSGALTTYPIDVKYTVSGYTDVSFNPNTQVRTISYNLSGQATYLYNVSIVDLATNRYDTSFNLNILTVAPILQSLTLSGSSNPYATINGSGQTLIMNVSSGILLLTISGAIGSVTVDLSYNSKDPSGIITNSAIPFPFSVTNLSGLNSCVLTLRDLVNNVNTYPLTIRYSTAVPTNPTFTLSGISTRYTTGSTGPTGSIVYTNLSNGTITLSGDSNVQYIVSHNGIDDPSGIDSSGIFTIPYSLSDNSYNYILQMTNLLNSNPATAYFTLVVDTVTPNPPTLTMTNLVNGYSKVGISGCIFSISGEIGTTYTLSHTLGGTTYQDGSGELLTNIRTISGSSLNNVSGDGLYIFSVYLTDKAKNSSTTYTLQCIVDTKKPDPPYLNIANSQYTSLTGAYTNVGISGCSFFLSGEALTTYVLSHTLDGSAPIIDSSGDFPGQLTLFGSSFTSVYPDGSYNFSVVLTDAAGNSSISSSVAFVVDTIKPGQPKLNLSIPPSGITNISGISLGISGDIGTVYSLYLDGIFNVSGNMTTNTLYTIRDLSDGTHTLYSTLTDLAGNISISSEIVTWQVDVTRPNPPYFSITNSQYTTSLSGTYTKVGISGCFFTISGEALTTYFLSHTLSGSASVIDSSGVLYGQTTLSGSGFNLSGDGVYVFSVYLVDPATNPSLPVSIAFTVDTKNPSPPYFKVANGQYASLSGTYTKIGISGCTFSISGEAFSSYVLSHTLNGSSEIIDSSGPLGSLGQSLTISGNTLNNVASDGSYIFKVAITDRAGNQSGYSSVAFVVDTISPIQPTFSISGGTTIGSTVYTSLSSDILNIQAPGENGTIFSISGYSNLSGTIVGGVGTVRYPTLISDITSFSILFTDLAQNQSRYPLTIKYGTAPPASPTILVSGVPSRSSQGTPIIYTDSSNGTITLSGDTSIYYTVTLDGQSIPAATNVMDTSGQLVIPYSADNGSYTYSVHMVNLANLTSDVSFVLFVDTIGPSRPVLLLEILLIDSSSCSLSISGDVNSSYYISIDGSSNYPVYPDPSSTYAIYYPVIGMATFNVSGILTSSPQLITLDGLGEGIHNILVYLRDIAGNPSVTQGLTIRTDTRPPEQPSVILITNPLTDSSSCTLTISGEQGTNYFIYVDGSSNYTPFYEASGGYTIFTAAQGIPMISLLGYMDVSSISITLNGLADGSHNISVYLRDLAGNASTVQTVSVRMDTIAPILSSVVLLTNALTDSSSCTLTISGEQGTNYFIYVDGSSNYTPFYESSGGYTIFTAVSSVPILSLSGYMNVSPKSITLNGLADGSHNIAVYLRDFAGNASTVQTVSVRMDTTPPTQPICILSATLSSISSCTLTISGEQGTNYFIYVDGSSSYMPFYESSGGYTIFTVVPSVPMISLSGYMEVSQKLITLNGLADGSHNIYVYLRDVAGNVSEPTLRQIRIDTIPPNPAILTIMDPQNRNLSGTTTHYSTAILTVSGEYNSTYQIFLNGVVKTTDILQSTVSRTYIELSGPQTISVLLTDQAGNTSTQSTISWIVNTYSDPPTISEPSGSSGTIRISGEIGTTFEVRLNGITVSTGTMTTLITYTYSSLSPDIYTLDVYLTNYAGYISMASKTWTVPLILSVIGNTILSWNSSPGALATIKLVNTNGTQTTISQTTNSTYTIVRYGGLSIRCVISVGSLSSNIVSTVIPPLTTDISINPIDYIGAAINSTTDASSILTIVNSPSSSFTSPFVIVPTGLTKFIDISSSISIQDQSFIMVFSPSGSIILPSDSLNPALNGNARILYLTGAVGTSTTYNIDTSQNKNVVHFYENSVVINDVSYSIGQNFIFGSNTYTLIALGSAVGVLFSPPSITIVHEFNSIRNNRSYYDTDYILSEQDRIDTLHLEPYTKTQYKTYAEKTLATRNKIITKCYKPDSC